MRSEGNALQCNLLKQYFVYGINIDDDLIDIQDTVLGGVVDAADGCAAIQQDLDKL